MSPGHGWGCPLLGFEMTDSPTLVEAGDWGWQVEAGRGPYQNSILPLTDRETVGVLVRMALELEPKASWLCDPERSADAEVLRGVLSLHTHPAGRERDTV